MKDYFQTCLKDQLKHILFTCECVETNQSDSASQGPRQEPRRDGAQQRHFGVVGWMQGQPQPISLWQPLAAAWSDLIALHRTLWRASLCSCKRTAGMEHGLIVYRGLGQMWCLLPAPGHG